MRDAFGSRRSRDAQTFVFFALTFATIFLLCGLAIDSGLLFLAKARIGRAVDGAVLAAVGNFNQSSDPATNRQDVALILRNFAIANYTDLGSSQSGSKDSGPISSTYSETKAPYTTNTGATAYTYTCTFTDSLSNTDANGQLRKFVQVVLTTGTGGQITSATCNARCPVNTYFIGVIDPFFRDLKVSASSVATRNPRLIMIVVDRSTSMLQAGGGAYGLPQAIVQFLDFFDTSSDYIGIVSFGSYARLEMPLTTNFIVAGTNLLFDAYDIDTNTDVGTPGLDPEDTIGSGDYDPYYAYSGVRRLKFGGTTAADEGMRLAMEQLMDNSGFNDPDVVKYLVLFTDGAWNQTRTLFAAPPYTNWVSGPPTGTEATNGSVATNALPWSTNIALDHDIIPVPTLSPLPYVTNAILQPTQISVSGNPGFGALVPNHLHDIWQSADGTNEPFAGASPTSGPSRIVGAPMTVTSTGTLGLTASGTTIYSRYIDVWLQPGAVDYEWSNNAVVGAYVSDLTNPTNHIQISQYDGTSNELVVPGYVMDGLFFDGLDLCWYDNSVNYVGLSTYPSYKVNNYQEYFMWPDDGGSTGITNSAPGLALANAYTAGTSCTSLERQLMFRNYPNLLTGFYINRADDPPGPTGDTNIFTGATNPAYGLGPYYPGGSIYWPFDLVGVDYGPNYALTNESFPDPDPWTNSGKNGGSRHASYSINMHSTNASPEWAGEWFYEGTNGPTSYSSPGNTAASFLMSTKGQWQSNAPSWLTADFDAGGETIMTNEPAHDTNTIPTASVWRPNSFIGTYIGTTNSALPASNIIMTHNSGGGSHTGGYVIDGSGNVYTDSMGYSGRPTHYFDFSQSQWVVVGDNHNLSKQALPLGYWKVQEYAWHARAMGVTIYTVGYGYLVKPKQQVILAQVANATNTTAGNVQGTDGSGNFYYTDTGGTGISYNPNQPIGQQYFATNSSQISNDFYSIGQAINAALTQ